MGHAQGDGCKARVICNVGTAHRLGHLAELCVVSHGQDQMPVRGWKGAVGNDVHVALAQAARRLVCGEVVHGLVGQCGDLHVKHADVDLLAFAARIAVTQCRQDGD